MVTASPSSRTVTKPRRSYSPRAGFAFSTLSDTRRMPRASAWASRRVQSRVPSPRPRQAGETPMLSSGISGETNPYDGSSAVISEDVEGWKELVDALPDYLPGCLPFHEWFFAVAFPAFEPNPTELFWKSGE